MFLARQLVNYSRAAGIDPFSPDAAGRLAQQPAAKPLLAELASRLSLSDAAAILILLLQALEIEATEPRGNDSIVECVATLPKAYELPTRPTRVVIREMMTAARRSVLVAGYLITDENYLLPLAQAAAGRGVEITLVCDRNREDAQRIRTKWPEGFPLPKICINNVSGDHYGKMHAKVLVVDDYELLVTSANFTWHGQEVNIEYGLRISGEPARKTTLFFRKLEQFRAIVPMEESS